MSINTIWDFRSLQKIGKGRIWLRLTIKHLVVMVHQIIRWVVTEVHQWAGGYGVETHLWLLKAPC